MKHNFFLTIILLGIVLIGIASCTKYKNPPPVFEDYDQVTDSTLKRKVLLVTISGGVSSEIKKIMPATIAELMPNSKYSWDGLSEVTTTDEATWASIATGVHESKHTVYDNSFLPTGNNQGYPTFLYRILNNQSITAPLKTISITSWPELNNSLFIHANDQVTTGSDVDTKNAAVANLAGKDYSLYLVDFEEPLKVGKVSGFSSENTAYSNAIKKTDEYIGELLSTIKSRASYQNENWLVILTTPHGAIGNGYGGNSLQERQIFSLFYNMKYKSLEIKGNFIKSVYYNQQVTALANDPNGIYNFNGEGMTVSFKIRTIPNSSGSYDYNWPTFLGKKASIDGSIGWQFHHNRGGLGFTYSNGPYSKKYEGSLDSRFRDGKWHSITAKLYKNASGSHIVGSVYVDGIMIVRDSIVNQPGAAIANDLPLYIGSRGSGAFNMYITDVRIYNKAISDVNIFSNSCELSPSSSNPDNSSLIGHWSADVNNGVIKNSVSGNPDLALSGPFVENVSGNTLSCTYGPEFQLMENTTIAPTIFYWLGITAQASWELDGIAFLKDFEAELQ